MELHHKQACTKSHPTTRRLCNSVRCFTLTALFRADGGFPAVGCKIYWVYIRLKNPNWGQKYKFRSKIEILVKNWNFGQKLKFWSKIEILVKNWNFGQKLIFWSKIEISVKNSNFDQKFKFRSKIQILAKNSNVEKLLNFFNRSWIFCFIWP